MSEAQRDDEALGHGTRGGAGTGDDGPARARRAGIEPVDELPPGRRQLHLTGFMASGKSTVGRLLARRLVWNFLDLDAVVVRMAGRPVAEIFAREGEEGFRRHEHQALRQVVQKPRTVVALGGGTLIDRANRELCRAAAVVVWLDVPLEVARERVGRTDQAGSQGGGDLGGAAEVLSASGVGPVRSAGDGVERPLWGRRGQLEERLQERLPGYRSAAIRVDADAAPEAVADAVLEALAIDLPPAGPSG